MAGQRFTWNSHSTGQQTPHVRFGSGPSNPSIQLIRVCTSTDLATLRGADGDAAGIQHRQQRSSQDLGQDLGHELRLGPRLELDLYFRLEIRQQLGLELSPGGGVVELRLEVGLATSPTLSATNWVGASSVESADTDPAVTNRVSREPVQQRSTCPEEPDADPEPPTARRWLRSSGWRRVSRETCGRHLLPSAVALHVVDDLADGTASPPHDLLVGARVVGQRNERCRERPRPGPTPRPLIDVYVRTEQLTGARPEQRPCS